MKQCIYVSTSISLSFILSLGVSLSSWAHLPLATSTSSNENSGRPSMGHPRQGTRRGGGSRGGMCDLPSNVPALTALMPDTGTWLEESAEATEVVFSFTTSATPDVWFYLPYTLVESSQVVFTLKDTAGETLKRVQLDTTTPLPTGPSIMGVSLAELGINLIADTDYHWYLTVHCEAGPTIAVDGWINYQPNPQTQPSDKQFLVDTLSALAVAQLSNPGDSMPQAAWHDLLDSVGLGDIANVPIVDCCSFVE